MASRQNKRRPSNFVQRTNAHFKAIERQLNPQPKFGSTVGDPPAITNQGKFIDRVVLVNPVAAEITIGNISQALKSVELTGSGPTGDFYIRSIKIWGSPLKATLSVSAKFFLTNLLVAASSNSDSVVVKDYGTTTRRPGVRCTIPLPASKLQNFDTTSTLVVADVISGPDTHECI